MPFVFGMFFLFVFIFMCLKDEGERVQKKKEQYDALSGGGTFIKPYDEYVIHCESVHRVNVMIERAKEGLVVTDEDRKEDAVGDFRFTDEYLLYRKAERIVSKEILGVSDRTRDQLAYYLTCKKVVGMGMKTNLMWGKDTSGLGQPNNTLEDIFRRTTEPCKGFHDHFHVGIGYPIHDRPHPEIAHRFYDCATARPRVYGEF